MTLHNRYLRCESVSNTNIYKTNQYSRDKVFAFHCLSITGRINKISNDLVCLCTLGSSALCVITYNLTPSYVQTSSTFNLIHSNSPRRTLNSKCQWNLSQSGIRRLLQQRSESCVIKVVGGVSPPPNRIVIKNC